MIEAGAAAVQMQLGKPPHVVSNALKARCGYRSVDDRRGLVLQTASDALQTGQIGRYGAATIPDVENRF